MSLGVQPVKDDSKLQIRQSPTEHLPRTPMRALFLANSGGGKTTLIANLLTRRELYGKAFSTFYIFSPSVHHDGTWQSVKKYMREEMGQKPEEHFFDKWDPQQTQEIVDTQFQITKHHKDHGHRRGHSICIVIDDWADRADVLHRGDGGGVLNSFFIRGRHANISTWIASQRPTLLSTTLRTQATSLFVFRQRSMKDLLTFLDEYSAIVPKKTLEKIYTVATREKYNFLMVDLMQPAENMFYWGLDKMLRWRGSESEA